MVDEILSRNVFIVHGTDHSSLNELKTLLDGVGLYLIILHEQASTSMALIEN